MRYRDRVHAGRELGAALARAGCHDAVILGIPRGGVVVAAEAARFIDATLGVVVARKLGAPGQPELAIGAITSDGTTYLDDSLAASVGATGSYLDRERMAQAAEARRREDAFDGHLRPALAGRTVVVVDDGIATGATAIAALRSVRKAGAARTVLAVPVANPRAIERLRREADEVVCPLVDPDLYAVGQYYDDFRQVEDGEVREVLAAARGSAGEVCRETVTIVRDGQRLAGTLSLPAGEGAVAVPAVVFVHGLGSGKDSPRNVVVAEALHDEGIATLLFDLNGHGESTADPRGSPAFADDFAAAAGWLRTHPAVDPARVGAAGSSLGGVAVLDALRAGTASPRAIVLRAPPIEPPALDGLTIPALVLAGERDPLLPGIMAAARGRPHVTVELVPGAGHLFEEPGALEDATRRTVRWLARQLRA